MGRPSLREQIDAINQASAKYPSLSEHLNLYRNILQVRMPVEAEPTKGTSVNWNDLQVIKSLEQQVKTSRLPIINFLDPTIFDEKPILQICQQVTHILIEHGIDDGLKIFSTKLDNGEIDVQGLISATLKGDMGWLERNEEMLGAKPTQLLFIFGTAFQPCLEEIARKVDPVLLENWWQAICPVCGRTPIIARLRQRKRYLSCILCGTEYLADLFLCVKCGNMDQNTLKFILPEESREFRIDFCEKCKYYIKVIDEDKLKTPIPRGLEDILTLDLDLMAKNAGLIRS